MGIGSWIMAAIIAVGSIAPAYADREDRREQRRQRTPQQEQEAPQRAEREPREVERRGRLTPEEREQLRRDVRDAGRGIYGERRGRNN